MGGYPFNFLFISSLLLVPPENSPTSQTSIVQKCKGGKQEKNKPEPVALVCFDGCRCIMRDDTTMCKIQQSNEENTRRHMIDTDKQMFSDKLCPEDGTKFNRETSDFKAGQEQFD